MAITVAVGPTIDDLLGLMPPPVWSQTAPNLTSLLSTFTNEMDRWADLANFVHMQVNITTSEGEFLNIHGQDFGVPRVNNPFTSQPESDAAYQAAILSVFQAVRLNKYALENLLAPYSNNPPVIYESAIDHWFCGGNPAVDFQPFSFTGFDTTMESVNLINSINFVSNSTDNIVFTVDNNAVPGQYIQLPTFINVLSANQFSFNIPTMNYQGALPNGRKLAFISIPNDTNASTITYAPTGNFYFEYGTVQTQEYLNNQNIVTLNENILDNLYDYPLVEVEALGDTLIIIYQEPTTQYLYMWTAQIDPNGSVTINEAKRADTVPASLQPAGILPLGPDGTISDYGEIDFSLLSVRGQLDWMYEINLILSFVSVKSGDAGNSGGGLFCGELLYPPPTKVLSALTANELAGIGNRIFLVPNYIGNYLNNSNNLMSLYG